MGRTSKVLIAVGSVVVIILGGVIGFVYRKNHYQVDGKLVFPGIKSPVRVIRDEKNMPFIYAESLNDALKVQGYVMAQDRLFQMHLTRLFASGRIAELAGEKARASDLKMRTLGFTEKARKHAAILSEDTRTLLENYRDGINAYIETDAGTHHLEFSLSGLEPEPWTLEDSLTIMYYMGWGSAANLKTEVVAQMLAETLGVDAVKDLFPINTNIDSAWPAGTDPAAETGVSPATGSIIALPTGKGLGDDRHLLDFIQGMEPLLKIGSNNWCASSDMSTGGKPILASDPHLATGMLPGILYPSGLIFGDMRVVGVTIAGFPGAIIGRNSFLAAGMTNSYGDCQDLYIETIDPERPDHYLEGDASFLFEIRQETLKIKDKAAPGGFRLETVEIRSTRRGPVVSGVLPGLETNRCVTVRWAPFETMSPDTGFDYLLRARSAEELTGYLGKITSANMNITAADVHGTLVWQTTGKLPVRSRGDGTLPLAVDGSGDNWQGFIPFARMPHAVRNGHGWLGNANHNTTPADYPYYVSSYFSPYYRYLRLRELMEAPGKKEADDHWTFQRDTVNVLARKLVPVFVKTLAADPATRDIADRLKNWNFKDDADQVAPTLYHALYERLARHVFSDELGAEKAGVMLKVWYFWQERLERMILEGDSPWFDDIHTGTITETLPDLILRAAGEITSELTQTLGKDRAAWTWGQAHRLAFVNPIRRSGPGTELLGGKTYAMGGSCETLYRALYPFETPKNITISAALRMVVDLSDADKILAVLPGGVSGRTFSPHLNDQVAAYMSGEKRYWWFSDKEISRHKEHELACIPET